MMAKFVQVFSTGRCGTQFLARSLAGRSESVTVRHEPGGEHYMSRHVLRQPDKYAEVLAQKPQLDGLFQRIEKLHLERDRSFVSFAWPAFAWLPYMSERFAGDFAFAHLVRNPLDSAASHCTHDTMQTSGFAMLDDNKIHASDPSIHHIDAAGERMYFSAYERQLFHWLEVNTFLAELHDLPGFLGVFRFEDLTGADPAPLNNFASTVLGEPTEIPERKPFDRVHRGLITHLTSVRPTLLAPVTSLGANLGYAEDELNIAERIRHLRRKYQNRRFDLPCDPRIPVVEK